MPFTPFHFGPGAAIKAAAPMHFSFTLFCYAQVMTDTEPGYHMLRGEYPVHGFIHTFLGASAVAIFCAVTGRYLCQWALRVVQELSDDGGKPADISWSAAFLTAFIGTWSHVVLDGMVHRDMRPFAPFTEANPFLGLIGIDAVHNLCVILGVAGLLVWFFRRLAVGRPR